MKVLRGKTYFYTKSLEDFDKLKHLFVNCKLQFYTYTPKTRSKIKMVLKGLPPGHSQEEVQSELQRKINFDEIRQFKKKVDSGNIVSIPVFLITFSSSTPVKSILAIKDICFNLITWEKYRSKNPILQCYNCQQFNHVAYNCNMPPHCMKCGQTHATITCTSNDANVCSNCSGQHRSNSKECPRYIMSLQNKVKRSAVSLPMVFIVHYTIT